MTETPQPETWPEPVTQHFIGHYCSMVRMGVVTHELYWPEGAIFLRHEWQSASVRSGATNYDIITIEGAKRRMRKWGGTYAPGWNTRRLTRLQAEVEPARDDWDYAEQDETLRTRMPRHVARSRSGRYERTPTREWMAG